MRPLGIIVLIVLVDLLGFTIVMPLLGPFGAHYGFSDWQIGLLAALADDVQEVAGLAGMVVGQRQIFGAAATTHVETMRGITSLQRGVGHAAGVAGGTGSFESMDHDNFASRWTVGTL